MSNSHLSDVSAIQAAAMPIATAPFGYLLGYLFTVHLVHDETTAVWLTTVALASLAMLLWAAWQS